MARSMVRSSISSTPLTSVFADAMEDDGTALDRGPRGSGSLAGLSTLLKRAMIHFMKTLYEPVVWCKNFQGYNFHGLSESAKTAKILLENLSLYGRLYASYEQYIAPFWYSRFQAVAPPTQNGTGESGIFCDVIT